MYCNLGSKLRETSQGTYDRTRFAVHIRSWRRQAGRSSNASSGSAARPRTMYHIRSSLSIDSGHLVIDDPSAPLRATAQSAGKTATHYRQTVSTLHAPALEGLLSRVLTQSTPAGSSGGNASNQVGWIARPSSLTLDGHSISVGDYVVRAGTLTQKGGNTVPVSSILIQVCLLHGLYLTISMLMKRLFRRSNIFLLHSCQADLLVRCWLTSCGRSLQRVTSSCLTTMQIFGQKRACRRPTNRTRK